MFQNQTVSRLIQYERTGDEWRAQFTGPFTVSIEAPTVDECRFRILDLIEQRVVEWLIGRDGLVGITRAEGR
jgi:hypothetical protein